MTHGDFEFQIGPNAYSIDWGTTEDPDECPSAFGAAVYLAPWSTTREVIYVHADDKDELFKLATEAARTLDSRVDWRAEWERLSRAVRDEADYCAGAARFRARQGLSCTDYQREAKRLRRIHAGNEPADLNEDLAASVRVD